MGIVASRFDLSSHTNLHCREKVEHMSLRHSCFFSSSSTPNYPRSLAELSVRPIKQMHRDMINSGGDVHVDSEGPENLVYGFEVYASCFI